MHAIEQPPYAHRQRPLGTLWKQTWRVAAALALAWAGAAGSATAADVYWSIGIQQPGVQVVVGQPRPAPVVLVPTQRVVVVPGPVYRGHWVPPGHARPVKHAYWHDRWDDRRGDWKDERRHHHGDQHQRDGRRDGYRDELRNHGHAHRH